MRSYGGGSDLLVAEALTGAEVFGGGSGAGRYGAGRGSYGGFGSSRSMNGQSRGFSSGRNSGSFGNRSFGTRSSDNHSFGNRSSNFRSATNDGRWHSFGNAGSSSRFSGGRNSGNFASSGLCAHNGGRSDGGWRSFGPSRGSSPGMGSGRISRSGSIRSGAGFGGSHFGGSTFGNSSFAGSRSGHSTFRSFGEFAIQFKYAPVWQLALQFLWRPPRIRQPGIWPRLGLARERLAWERLAGNRYGGFGWRGYGWNRGFWPGYYNYGWGGGFFGVGFGWGWAGVGWPYWGSYWGPGWAFGWDPWWYNPYWYSPWPSYNYYQDYPDIGYDNRPSYAPDALSDYDSSSSYLITPTLDPGPCTSTSTRKWTTMARTRPLSRRGPNPRPAPGLQRPQRSRAWSLSPPPEAGGKRRELCSTPKGAPSKQSLYGAPSGVGTLRSAVTCTLQHAQIDTPRADGIAILVGHHAR